MKNSKNYCCKDCGDLIVKNTALYGNGRCKKCRGKTMIGKKQLNHSKKMMGNKNPNWKGGRTNKLPYCIDCGKKLSEMHCKRCINCWKNYNKGKNHFSYQGLKERYCVDCNKLIITYNKIIRCKSCENLNRCGKNHPFFGKAVPPPKLVIYKNINFRSLWEANFAKWLDLSKTKWIYEPRAFELILNKKLTSYIPDFYLPEFDCYIEIKGWWRDNAKNKVKLFLTKYSKINYRLYFKKDLQELGIIK